MKQLNKHWLNHIHSTSNRARNTIGESPLDEYSPTCTYNPIKVELLADACFNELFYIESHVGEEQEKSVGWTKERLNSVE